MDDPRLWLRDRLIKQGCNPELATLISIEAGGSQAFVNAEYLAELGIQHRLIKRYLKSIAEFYFTKI